MENDSSKSDTGYKPGPHFSIDYNSDFVVTSKRAQQTGSVAKKASILTQLLSAKQQKRVSETVASINILVNIFIEATVSERKLPQKLDDTIVRVGINIIAAKDVSSNN